MKSPTPTTTSLLPVALLLVGASLLTCLPLFGNLDYWGRQDWDQFTFRYETPRLALLRDHVFPSWNPYANGGTALVAHPDSPALSPWYLTVLLLGAPFGLRVQAALFMAIGAVGMAALTRRLGASRMGSLVGGIVFMMSAHYTLHIAEGHLEWCVLGLMPWLALFLLRAEEERRFVIWAALLLASVLTFGTVYIPAVFLPFFSVWALLRVAHENTWRPLLRWGMVACLAGLLSAVKLLPTTMFASVGEREVMIDQRTRPGVMLAGMLHPRQALLYRAHRDRDVPDGHFAKTIPSEEATPIAAYLNDLGVDARFHEYGFYIGGVGLLLAAFGFLNAWRRLWPLYGAGALASVTALGASSPVDLWLALRQLPLFGQLQVPSRFLAAVVFVLAVAAAVGLGALLDEMGELRSRLRRGTAVALVLVLYGELLMIGWSLFRDVFVVPPVAHQEHTAFAQRFRERFAPGTGESDYELVVGSAMYGHMRSNSGTLDAYENLTVPRGAVRTTSDPDYRGELYLEHERGTAEIGSWTMSRVIARVAAESPDSLVLNQNFTKGWTARRRDGQGRESRAPALAGSRGLVTVPVGPEHVEVELSYTAPGLAVGAWISSATLLVCLGWLGLVARAPLATVPQSAFPVSSEP